LRAIFISYRRHDSEGEAGRLFDDLVEQFGESSVFMDVAAIEVGRDFRKAVDESVANCGVLLAIIGLRWLDEKSEAGQRRLEDPNDFVRIEIASALKRDIPVVPVLVHGAKMPRADQLPDDLKDLAYRNAVEVTHARWKSDIKLLIRSLRSLLGDSRDVLAARGIKASADVTFVPMAKYWGITDSSPDTTAYKLTPDLLWDPRAGGARNAGAPGAGAGGAHPHSDMNQVPAASRPPNLPPGIANSSPTAEAKPAADCGCAGGLDPAVLARITMELTHYIGPIAEVVVRRAAKKCATVADLRRMVAEEIETSAERTQFLDACRGS
jgi:TIR domain